MPKEHFHLLIFFQLFIVNNVLSHAGNKYAWEINMTNVAFYLVLVVTNKVTILA